MKLLPETLFVLGGAIGCGILAHLYMAWVPL